MDEINWTNKNLAQNTSFNHINAVTIWNPILDQRKGGSKRHRNFNALQMWLFKLRDSSRPWAPAPAGHWLMPATSSPFDKLVFSYHSPLPARGKNSRVTTWQSCAKTAEWRQLGKDLEAFNLLQVRARRDWISSYLSHILISIILHMYLNYPTYVSQLSYISCHLSHLSATCLCSG